MSQNYCLKRNNMRLDHIAYRVKDRFKTVEFLKSTLGYRIDPELPNGFQIVFDDGSTTDCFVLIPPEKVTSKLLWEFSSLEFAEGQKYHLAPEIFVSDGVDGSIVGEWVKKTNGGVGGIHHLAYQVKSVQETMDDLSKRGLAKFTSNAPITCEGLEQVFTQPSKFTGIIYEFINRGKQGFCQSSVKYLMQSTKDFS